jgi:molecular chaperone Hsp33
VRVFLLRALPGMQKAGRKIGHAMPGDRLTRIICETLNLSAYTVTTLDVVREITSLHDTTPNATVALGRTVTAAALLAATLKPGSDQNLLLKIQGSGPIREIHVQADARGNIRGYAFNPRPDETGEIGTISFSETIGAGVLTVRKDIGLKEPYTGIVPLRAGEVAGDLAYYLAESEQVPSAVIIALTLEKDGTITSSGGMLIQTLPGTPEEAITRIENAIALNTSGLGETLRKGEDVQSYLGRLINNEPMTVLGSTPLRASCRCTRSIIRSMLTSIHVDELEDMLEKDHGAEITCTFCMKKYHFDEKELARIINKVREHDRGELPGSHSLQ